LNEYKITAKSLYVQSEATKNIFFLDFSKKNSYFCLIKLGNDIAVDPEKFFNANFAKKTYFCEKYLNYS